MLLGNASFFMLVMLIFTPIMGNFLTNSWLGDLLGMVYPDVCAACGKRLRRQEEVICLHCEYNLPQTNYHLDADNPVARHFEGRVELQRAASLYLFIKGERVQKLIHNLKYKGHQQVGVRVGQIYGRLLAESGAFGKLDLIVPVPLHPIKRQRRGYNQSDLFAQGLSETLHIPYSTTALVRKEFGASQTRKERFARWENVEEIFGLGDAEQVNNKHVLLIDDVITTGSTIEACVLALQNANNVKVSVASIAYAQY